MKRGVDCVHFPFTHPRADDSPVKRPLVELTAGRQQVTFRCFRFFSFESSARFSHDSFLFALLRRFPRELAGWKTMTIGAPAGNSARSPPRRENKKRRQNGRQTDSSVTECAADRPLISGRPPAFCPSNGGGSLHLRPFCFFSVFRWPNSEQKPSVGIRAGSRARRKW